MNQVRAKYQTLQDLYVQWKRKHWMDITPEKEEVKRWMEEQLDDLYREIVQDIYAEDNLGTMCVEAGFRSFRKATTVAEALDVGPCHKPKRFYSLDLEAYELKMDSWRNARDEVKKLVDGAHTINDWAFTVKRPRFSPLDITRGYTSVTIESHNKPNWREFVLQSWDL